MQPGLKRIATIAVLRSERGLLLLKRSRPPHIGKYAPVGGKIDPHETPAQTIRRETHEETGQDIPHLRLSGIITETSPADYNWILYVYSAQVAPFTPPHCDEGMLAWIALDQIDSIPTPETDRFFYDYILRGQFFVLDAIYDADENLLIMREEITATTVYERQPNEQTG